MKKRGIWMVVSVLVVLGLILASCAKAPEAPTAPTSPTTTARPAAPTSPTAPTAPAPAQKEVIKWVAGTSGTEPGPIEGPMNGVRYPTFPSAWSTQSNIDNIYKFSGGRLEIELSPPDSIVLWTEGLAGTSRGAIDIMIGLLHGTAAGIIPEADLLNGLPLQYQELDEPWDAFYNWGLLAEVQPLFEKENVHIVPQLGSSWNVLGIKGDVRKLSDLKAKKIRAVGAMNTLMTALGATALVIPYSEGYMALKLGTIDGWVAAPTAVSYNYKFYETSKPYTVVDYPRMGMWTNSYAINLDSWKALPQDLQELLEVFHPMQVAYNNLVVAYSWAKSVLVYLEGKGHLQRVQFSEEDANTIIQAAYKQWDSVYGKKSANMARLVELGKKMVAAWGRPFPGYKSGW